MCRNQLNEHCAGRQLNGRETAQQVHTCAVMVTYGHKTGLHHCGWCEETWDASDAPGFGPCVLQPGTFMSEACPDCGHAVMVHRVDNYICSVCETVCVMREMR